MLGVFLLLAFSRLGHDCQDLLSPCDECVCVETRPRLYYHPEEFLGNGFRTHVNSKGKIPSTGGSDGRGFQSQRRVEMEPVYNPY